MRLYIFRILLFAATLAFIGEDIGRSFGWQAEDLTELAEKKEGKKEKSDEHEDKFLEAVVSTSASDFTEPLVRLVLHADFAILSIYLPIFSPPPNGRVA